MAAGGDGLTMIRAYHAVARDKHKYLDTAPALLPILGEQTFMMRIVSRSVLRITLIGAMKLDELAPFREEASESEGTVRRLSVAFNEPTRALLRRYRTRIRSTTYHEDGDYGMLEICPLFLPTIRVKMSRVR